MKQFKALLLADKIHFDDPVTTWNMANVMAKIDANGNVFPNKAKARDKIDIFLSMLDSYIAYQSHKDELRTYFDYNQKGGE